MKPEKWQSVEIRTEKCGETIWYISEKNGKPVRMRMVKFTRCG